MFLWYWPGVHAYDGFCIFENALAVFEMPEEVQALIAGNVTERPDWCRVGGAEPLRDRRVWSCRAGLRRRGGAGHLSTPRAQHRRHGLQ